MCSNFLKSLETTSYALSSKHFIPINPFHPRSVFLFIRSTSHYLNLNVNDIVIEHEELLCLINQKTIKLNELRHGAKLRKLILLFPRTRKQGHWNSILDTAKRYFYLLEYLPQLESPEIETLTLDFAAVRRWKDFLGVSKDSESETKKIQDSKTTVLDRRGLFDVGLDGLLCTEARLATDDSIIHSPAFESAIVEVYHCNSGVLSREECLNLALILKCFSSTVYEDDDFASFTNNLRKSKGAYPKYPHALNSIFVFFHQL